MSERRQRDVCAVGNWAKGSFKWWIIVSEWLNSKGGTKWNLNVLCVMVPRWIQDAGRWYDFILTYSASATIIVPSSCPSGTCWASTVYKPHADTTWLLSCAPVNTPAAEFGTSSSCLDYSLVNLSGRIFWNQWRPKGPTCCTVVRRSYGNCTGSNVVLACQKKQEAFPTSLPFVTQVEALVLPRVHIPIFFVPLQWATSLPSLSIIFDAGINWKEAKEPTTWPCVTNPSKILRQSHFPWFWQLLPDAVPADAFLVSPFLEEALKTTSASCAILHQQQDFFVEVMESGIKMKVLEKKICVFELTRWNVSASNQIASQYWYSEYMHK